METTAESTPRETLRTLPGDDVRQIMWRFKDRYDLQMLVQSSRSVARGIVAHLVADGARNSHEWTPQKAQLLKAFDEAGITTCFMDPQQGGFIGGAVGEVHGAKITGLLERAGSGKPVPPRGSPGDTPAGRPAAGRGTVAR